MILKCKSMGLMSSICPRLGPRHPPFRFLVVVGSPEVLNWVCMMKIGFRDQEMGVPGPGSIFLKHGHTYTICEGDSVGGVAQTWIIDSKTVSSSIMKPSIPLQIGKTPDLITPRLRK